MVRHTHFFDTVPSDDYRHDTACSLFEDDHEVAEEFIEVIEEAADRAPVTTDVGAAGCGSCFRTDDEAAIFWTAQGSGVETLFVSYDVLADGEFGKEDLGALIVEIAEEKDVDVDWTGDASQCVYLGGDDCYDD